MRPINWTKLLTRAGLRLLIAAVCAAICVAEFKSSEKSKSSFMLLWKN